MAPIMRADQYSILQSLFSNQVLEFSGSSIQFSSDDALQINDGNLQKNIKNVVARQKQNCEKNNQRYSKWN